MPIWLAEIKSPSILSVAEDVEEAEHLYTTESKGYKFGTIIGRQLGIATKVDHVPLIPHQLPQIAGFLTLYLWWLISFSNFLFVNCILL